MSVGAPMRGGRPGGARGVVPAASAERGRAPLRVHALVDSLACGGAEMLLAEFAGVAPAVGIEFSVGYLQDREGSPAAARLRAVGVEPELVGIPSTVSYRALRTVRGHVAAVAPDVLHTHLGAADLLGGRAARRLGVPWVSTVHAMDWVGGARERARFALAFAARRRADRVVTVSAEARRAYLERSRIPPERVALVPNGVSDRREPGAGLLVRAQLGIRESDPLVAVIAPLRHEKGHARALAALAAAATEIPQLRAVLVGAGPDEEEILAMAAPLGDRVLALGYRDDVMAVLDAADAVLHTPRTDALPTSLIEAAAAGVPVVATATGGVPEIVTDRVTGLLAPDDASPERVAELLVTLLRDDALRAALGRRARASFERRFAAELWAARLRRLYDEVVREAAR